MLIKLDGQTSSKSFTLFSVNKEEMNSGTNIRIVKKNQR